MPVGPRRYSEEQIRFVLERARQGLTHTQIVDAYRGAFNVTRDFGLAQVKYIKSAYGEAAEFGVPAMNRILRHAGEAPRRSMSNEPTLENREGTGPRSAVISPTYAQHLPPERPYEEQTGRQGTGTSPHDGVSLIETISHDTPQVAASAHGNNPLPPPSVYRNLQHPSPFPLHSPPSSSARNTNLNAPSVPPEAPSLPGTLNPSTLYSHPGGTGRIAQPPQGMSPPPCVVSAEARGRLLTNSAEPPGDPCRPPDDRHDVVTHTGPHDACQIYAQHFHGAGGAVGFPHMKELQQHVARMVAQEMATYFMAQQLALPQRPPV